jgi:FkbM family methyltransferase
MGREIPKPSHDPGFATKNSKDGWLMVAKDRGFLGDQETLFDLDDYVIPNCEQHRVAIQAGSGIGMWPARLSETFETVYTFEPNPELFYCSVRNAPQQNIFRYQAALGNVHGTADMSWGFSRNNYGGYYVIPNSKAPIPIMRIDDFHLNRVDLIMLDVEGHELEGFKGAKETIERCQPTLVWESKNATLAKMGITKQVVYDYLKSIGYRLKTKFHSNKDELWVPRTR